MLSGEDRFDPYLWDGSGEPDDQLRALERLLSRYRHRGEPPAVPEQPDAEDRPDQD